MTIRVKITHTQTPYNKCITVEEMTVDATGQVVSRSDTSAYKHIVTPGKSVELYVYAGQILQVIEGPPYEVKMENLESE